MKHILLLWGSFLAVSVLLFFFALPDTFAAYGEAPTFAGSSTNPPNCSNTAPKAVWPFTAKAVAGDKVALSWGKIEDVSSWTVAFGYAPSTYIYGISNFGDATWSTLTVNELPAGTYYFVIRGNNGCMPGPFSYEWKVTVGGGGSAFTGGQQLGAQVEAAAPDITAPPVGAPPTYTPPATGFQPPLPPAQPPVAPAPPVNPPWWQGIADFFNGLFGQK